MAKWIQKAVKRMEQKGTKGTFTRAAHRNHMGVQEFASHVLANPDKYSGAMRKKANFARNVAK